MKELEIQQDIDITSLKIGKVILLSGVVFTARDKAHQFLLKEDVCKMENRVIYHCGPIIRRNKVISAGPTTSARLNMYTPQLIEKYNIQGIIGKGGMDENVLQALRGKAVYFSAIGGAGALYSETMKVNNVYKLEFGMPEAIWEFEIKAFPVVVAMDSKGNSLYKNVFKKSKRVYNKLIK